MSKLSSVAVCVDFTMFTAASIPFLCTRVTSSFQLRMFVVVQQPTSQISRNYLFRAGDRSRTPRAFLISKNIRKGVYFARRGRLRSTSSKKFEQSTVRLTCSCLNRTAAPIFFRSVRSKIDRASTCIVVEISKDPERARLVRNLPMDMTSVWEFQALKTLAFS